MENITRGQQRREKWSDIQVVRMGSNSQNVPSLRPLGIGISVKVQKSKTQILV